MAILGSNFRTLLDIAKDTDSSGRLLDTIEILSQENAILDDIPWIECNNGDTHKTSIRTGLPTPIWRKMYKGIPASKATSAVVQDTTGMLASLSEVDKDLADMNGNAAAYRLREDAAHLEAMAQEFCNCLFYGSEKKKPETFTGLAPRFSDATNANNKDNILAGAQTSNSAVNSSIWLIAWDPSTIHGIYPKGFTAGFKHTDKGVDWAVDSSGNRYEAYISKYDWKCGLSVRDWRYVVRIIFDSTALTANAASGANLPQLMEIAQERIHSLNKGHLAWYMNKKTAEYLRLQLADAAKYQLTRETVAGKKVTTYGGIPIRICEAITNTEAHV